MTSKLLSITARNLGCIGDEPVTVRLDDVLCLVGPNNSGKTTILRAYELAVTPTMFSPQDRCTWAPPEGSSEIIIDVHIPEGVGNVDEKWKRADGPHLVVKSRWLWSLGQTKHVRQTWDPLQNDWAEDGKAGGADNVFKSRLPRPMRIKSLDDALSTENVLLTLALSPFVSELKVVETTPDSKLTGAKRELANTVNDLLKPHIGRLGAISDKVSVGFQNVFPGLGVRLHVEMLPPELNLESLLKQGSGIRVDEASGPSRVAQQGTGARRALFWAMLQVHNELSRETEQKEALLKALNANITKEERKAEGKQDKSQLDLWWQQLNALKNGGVIPEDNEDPAFPGYILLIDEPENALHPMAARSAQAHLYALAKDKNWQVLLTTHSPYFVNPLEDHTTIVRMERSPDGKTVSPRVYISDNAEFTADERSELQALQLMDAGFSEIFFGSYPVLVEGDTEHAAFMAAIIKQKHEYAGRVSIIRARGKAILVALMKMLRHFKADHGIVHDVDWPYRSDGANNAMWTINQSIRDQITLSRASGIKVRHRWSVPDFERFIGGDELGKDKPYTAFRRIEEDGELRSRVRKLVGELFESDQYDPPECEEPFINHLRQRLEQWAEANGQSKSSRLVGKPGA